MDLKFWRRSPGRKENNLKLEALCASGTQLAQRLQRFVATPLSAILEEERIKRDEVYQWFTDAENTVITLFGESSKETRSWIGELTALNQQSDREIMQRQWNEAASTIRALECSLKLLKRFQR